jgi:hypothetical protein
MTSLRDDLAPAPLPPSPAVFSMLHSRPESMRRRLDASSDWLKPVVNPDTGVAGDAGGAAAAAAPAAAPAAAAAGGCPEDDPDI